MLTTDYDATYKAIQDSEEDFLEIISDFGVAIPISELLTASLYRGEVHTKYFPHEDPPDTTQQVTAGTIPADARITQERKIRPEKKEKISD